MPTCDSNSVIKEIESAKENVVGASLFQQSFTGFCPAGIIMNKAFGFKPCAGEQG
jgi:hypothetical protein